MQRCNTKSKRSNERCKNYAVQGCRVCRMHGANGGPKTQQGKAKAKMVRLTHGFYSELERQERKASRKELNAAKNIERHVDSLISHVIL